MKKKSLPSIGKSVTLELPPQTLQKTAMYFFRALTQQELLQVWHLIALLRLKEVIMHQLKDACSLWPLKMQKLQKWADMANLFLLFFPSLQNITPLWWFPLERGASGCRRWRSPPATWLSAVWNAVPTTWQVIGQWTGLAGSNSQALRSTINALSTGLRPCTPQAPLMRPCALKWVTPVPDRPDTC